MSPMRIWFTGAISCLAVLLVSAVLAERPDRSTGVSRHRPPEVRDLRVGERYAGGTRVRSPFMGVSFLVPKEWRASLPAGSVVFLDSAIKPGLGVIHLLGDVGREDVVAGLSEPQALEAGFVLHPTGALKEDGNRLYATYAAGDDVGLSVAVLGPARTAVVYLLVGKKPEWELYEHLTHQLAEVTEFMSEEETRLLKGWYDRLSGMMLVPKLSVANDQPTAFPTIHLCSDGRFVSSLKLKPVPGRETEQGEHHETGTWRIEALGPDVRLILTKAAGQDRSYQVQDEGIRLLLDGQHIEPTISDRCF